MSDPIFDQLLDEQRQRKSALAGALTTSVSTNPDAFATQKRVAGFLGYPVAAVEAMPDLAEQAKVLRVQNDIANTPALKQRYTDADFAKLAHDDSGALSAIETSIAQGVRYLMGATPTGGVIGTIKAFPDRFASNVAAVKSAGADVVEPWARLISGKDNQAAQMSAYYKTLARQAEARGDALDPPDDSVVGGGLSGGVNSLLQSSKYLPIALAGGPAGAAIALGGMVAETFGQSYLKADEKGLPLLSKLIYGVSDGVIEYATEKGPLGALVHSIKAGTPLGRAILQNAGKEMKGEQIATALQDLNAWAALNPDKPFADYLAERPEAAAKTAIGVLVGAAGNTALTHSMQRSVDMMAGRDRQAEYNVAQATVLQEQLQAALNSKLRERSPDEFRAAVQAMADSAAENDPQVARMVFVDAEVLNQLPPEVQQLLPVGVLDQMAQALATGDAVEIPIGDALAIAPGTPLEQTLVEHGRIGDPSMPSQFEVKQAGTKAQEWLATEAQGVIAQAADAQAMQASSDAVSKTILDQLQATGRFRQAVNEGYATWAAAFYTTMAGRMGMTPEEMHARYPLRIVDQTGAGEVMDQPGSANFDKWFSDSKVVDGKGKPLLVYHGAPDMRFMKEDGVFKSQKDRIGVGQEQGAHWFTPSMSTARSYADPHRAFDYQNAEEGVVSAYIKLSNPLVIDGGGQNWRDAQRVGKTGDVIAEARAAGHDGIIIRSVKDDYINGKKTKPTDTYVVFDSTQIKSATGNNGDYDPQNPSVLNQTPGALPLWSLERAKGARITDLIKKAAISLAPKASMAAKNYEKLDAIFGKVPNPLASEEAWRKFMSLLVADRDVLGVPYNALKYAQSPQAVADYLARLRPDQLASRRAGFELGEQIRQQYIEGTAPALITGRLLLWAMLSRKAGAYPHEAAYMDLVSGGVDQWIQKALDGKFTEADSAAYVEWSSGFMGSKKGGASPSAGVTSNANDYGRILLTKMSEKDESGKSQLERLHDLIADQGVSTDEVRRAFFALGDSLGIQNKVLSFALLVTGRWDTLVLDRVQFTHLWGDTYRERAGQRNIYDNGLAAAGEGHFGLAVYEALARGMSPALAEGYKLAGLTGPGDGSLGAFHWDSWLIESSQAIGHPTIESLVTDQPRPDLAVRQGKFDTFSYNFEYRADGQYQIPLLDGSGYRIISPADAAQFQARIKDDNQGVVPKDFKVSTNKSAPWVDAPGVNRARYDEILNEYGRRADAEDVAPAGLADAGGSVQGDAADAAGQAGRAGAASQVLEQAASGFSNWVGDATVVGLGEDHDFMAGQPVVVGALHGTTGEFTSFDRAFANPESDLGAGFYATNSTDDVGTNYAGEGPDLTNKIQSTAERIASETDREYDDPEVVAEAKARFKANDGLTMPVWVKFTNPVVLGGPGETRLAYEESYDEEADEYGEPAGTLVDFVVALRETDTERYGDADIERAVADLFEAAQDGELLVSEVIRVLSQSEGLQYATDYESDNGAMASKEIIRQAFARAGYDGFIDQTVNSKFGNMEGLDNGTVHFIAFAPTQIKSRLGNDGTFDANDPNILSQPADTPRGTFSPASLELALNANANLSTFIHETGHFFLEVMADIASQPNAPAEITRDMQTLLAWFGVADLATWRALPLKGANGKEPYHERFAESIEQYLMEGKAPSAELQPLFRKMRAWMLNIYRSAKAFIEGRTGATEIQLSDEVRKVFDRMLASQEEIRQAEETAGMMPNTEATADAVEKLTARSMRDLAWTVRAVAKAVKALQRDAVEARKEVEAEVTLEVDAMPEMRAKAALDALQISPDFTAAAGMWREARATALADAQAKLKADLYAANPEATGLKKGQLLAKNKRSLANQAEAAMIAWEQANPKPTKPENVTDADLAVIADSFEFPDVDTMLTAIDAVGKRADLIEGLTDQRMLEQHGELVDEASIQAAANQAVHNEARAKSLATELKAQAEMANPRQDTGEVNSKGSKITVNAIVEAARQFAANVVAGTPIKDLKALAWKHTAAERRANTRWQQATMAGDTAAAVKAKQDQVLHNAAAKAAMDAMGEAKDIAEFFRKVVKDGNEKTVEKGRDPDVVNAARAILAAYGVGVKGAKSALDYLGLVEKNDPAMFAALQPSLQGALNMAQPIQSLTMEQLQGLHEEIQSMWHLARRSRQMEVQGDLIDIDDAADELSTRMAAIGVPLEAAGTHSALTPAETRQRWLQFAGSLLRRVEQWSEGMDGKYGGPFLRLVFGPVKAAADAYRADRVVYRKAYQALVDSVAPSLRKGLIEAPELGYTFGKGHNGIGHAELLHAILHTGNASNKRKLLLGRGWATENVDGTMDTTKWDAFIQRMHDTGVLGKAHYDFAQGVWDLLERTKPLAQKAHRDVFGRYFAEVTADAFDTPFGNYRGGYVPAQADPRIVQEADMRALASLENESMSFSFPATNKGFTKGRVEYNRPLMLDLRTIGQHIDKVLLFSHMEPAVRDVNKLLTRKPVSQPLGKIDPTIYAGMLTPWLNRSARQVVETPIVGDGGISRVLSAARSRAGMALMFANISNTLQQVTGFAGALAKLKADGMKSSMLKSTALFIRGPKKMAAAVAAASPFMANRMANEISAINATMNEILLDPGLYERAQAWSAKHAYFLQSAMDNTMGPIIWTAAYNAALGKSMSQDDAVRYADGVIRQTQGSTLPEDISRIETGPAYARVFTQFIGYFNMMANTNATAVKQIAMDVGLKKGAGKALGLVTLGLMVPVWIAEAIAQAMRGGPDDPDEDGWLDDWLMAVFGFGTIKGAFAMVPFVGQLANAGMNRFNGNPADDKMSLSPAVSLLEAAVGVPVDIYKAITDEVKLRTLVRDVASAVSIATGLPAMAIARPLGYLAGVEQGQIAPTSAADAVRGAITGSASPDSKQ